VSSLDRLSGGRVILGAGLGALHEGWTAFEADEGRRVRAEKMDEGLAIYAGLMAGQPFSFQGKHYTVKPTEFMLPAPTIQQPHPPVWVVGAAKVGETRQPSLERAARWQGWLPQVVDGEWRGNPRSPQELSGLTDQVRRMREEAGLSMEHFAICVEGEFYGAGPGERDIAAWADAGATWWIEGAWRLENCPSGRAELQRRIQNGPPGSPP